ncbi:MULTISPECIES: DUF4214 domain-containing protein [Acetobacter]|uniref:DUF4214 domain-containing protein n=1 Tax=Acetobacter TaxID=434 RepID=UPI0005564491|nr:MULTISPECIES: DUF4214 domain-containing protein [Acetobacter]ATI12901.1 DUF4214 domain-containing protein [Acetobacter pomorum]AXC26969.1 DUF4214 domain-containing protein [Acetobacter sp. JWB]KAA8421375.1 DUF4214 domain-containing protein [Acetobacter pomorum]KAA8435014.1 DUF4214 domain-containing protein [Acetobacter pomorum]KAA8449178.1 DUF4214 domain-containing protein [Acetobacter pomorum]
MFNNSSDVLVSVPHKTDEKILATSTNIKPEDLEIHGHISHNDVEKTKDIFSGKHDYFSHDAENIARGLESISSAANDTDNSSPVFTILSKKRSHPKETVQDFYTEANNTYKTILNRNGDPGGLKYFANDLMYSIINQNMLQKQMAQSPEAQNDLNSMSQQILGRDMTKSEDKTYTGDLATGTSLAQVRTDMAISVESQNNIHSIYVQETGQAPSAAQLKSAENELSYMPFGTVNGGTQQDLKNSLK